MVPLPEHDLTEGAHITARTSVNGTGLPSRNGSGVDKTAQTAEIKEFVKWEGHRSR